MVADTLDQQPCVFLAPLYQAERSIADQIKRLSTGRPALPAADVDKATIWVERKLGSSWLQVRRTRLPWR